MLRDALERPPDSGAAEAYHQRARLAEDRLNEVLAAYRKLKSDNESYRERITKTIDHRYALRRERLLLRFIDILDNLDRALEAAETTYAGEPLIEGLILVRTQLLQALQEEGLERIPVLGLPYDPNFSEAVETRPVDDPDHHHVVVKELLRGYRLHGRIARPSQVVIGEYKGALPAPQQPSPQGAPAVQPPGEEQARAPAAPPAEDNGPSIEEIVAKVEAQEALFSSAFDEEPPGGGKTKSEDEDE